jgi:2',3'-cyclic-nucleotide 2'-phosphodiesterase / 3'-nucleotidase
MEFATTRKGVSGASPPVGPVLRLIATTDLHLTLTGYDYRADRPVPGQGLLGLAPMIKAARQGASQSLLLDNGDFLTGDPLLEPGPQAPGPHPMIALMNRLGYDAVNLGNHEFDHGLAYLRRALAQARFPLLSANLRVSAATGGPPALIVPPAVILERRLADATGQMQDLRIGLFGLAPMRTLLPQINTDRAVLHVADPVETAGALAADLRQAGADLVVALCHGGITGGDGLPTSEGGALDLAGVAGIDAIIAGHTHRPFPMAGQASAVPGLSHADGTLHGVPTVLPGHAGSHLGVIDLSLEHWPGAGWQVTGHSVALMPATGAPRPRLPDLTAITAPVHRRARAKARQPLGPADGPVDSYFSQLRSDRAMMLRARAQALAAREMLSDHPDAALPLVIPVGPVATGDHLGADEFLDIPDGRVERRHLGVLSPFANRLALIALTGADLLDWMERAVSGFARIAEGGGDQPLFDPAFPPYGFDQIMGVDYQVDLQAPARTDELGRPVRPGASRIREAAIGGCPLSQVPRLIVATSQFRAGGGGGFPAATRGQPLNAGPTDLTQALITLLQSQPAAAPPLPAGRWGFAPIPGARGLFDTAPGAIAALAQVTDRRIVPLGPGGPGRERFALDFGG